MSFGETRQAIADALTGLDGVAGYAHPPDVVSTGDAWPLLTSADPSPLGSAVWTVVVVLGTGFEEADSRLDDLYGPVTEALTFQARLALTEVRPGRLVIDGAQILAAEFIGRADIEQ